MGLRYEGFKLGKIILNIFRKLHKGNIQIAKCPKKWKKSKRGGESAPEIKKSTIQNVLSLKGVSRKFPGCFNGVLSEFQGR